jgi:hypothetical protein
MTSAGSVSKRYNDSTGRLEHSADCAPFECELGHSARRLRAPLFSTDVAASAAAQRSGPGCHLPAGPLGRRLPQCQSTLARDPREGLFRFAVDGDAVGPSPSATRRTAFGAPALPATAAERHSADTGPTRCQPIGLAVILFAGEVGGRPTAPADPHPSDSVVAAASALAQEFTHFVRERRAAEPLGWLTQCHRTSITKLRQFASGLQKDYAAFLAACTPPWSSGPVEGHVTRLKLLKRPMYGRAHLDLLRIRVLGET